MDGLIDQLRNIQPKISDKTYLLMGKKYSPIDITKNNFHIVNPKSSKLTFIDGGQAVIFESAGFCLGFIRTAAVTYENNSRTQRDIKEFHILIKEENQKFICKTSPINNFDQLSFDPQDENLRSGAQSASCSIIISAVRRLAELEHASQFENSVIDGTLEARYPYELDYINRLQNVSSLAKTCLLTTNDGDAVTHFLQSFNEGSWSYYPIVENMNEKHPAQIYFVKLHKDCAYAFRFEHKGDIALDVISALAYNSTDPIFKGYPYGLVDADQSARVSEQEKKSVQTRISMKMGKDWQRIRKYLTSMDAHEILDNIRF